MAGTRQTIESLAYVDPTAKPPIADRYYRGIFLACLLLTGLIAGGCSRAFYRDQADCEVYCLERQGAVEVDAVDTTFSIQPAPQSRMADPYSPDFPPMPPDDPVSHRLMHCVDGMRGWPGWPCYGKTPYVQNPHWEAFLPRDPQGRVVLDRDAVVQLALCNSPDYQTQLENLYMSALTVTFERFQFDVQFFGGNDTFFDAQGRELGGGSPKSFLSTDTDILMRKTFAAGGELVVGAANSLVWQFAGPDDYNGTTLLNFEFVQPLLRYGGRAYVLENLTDSERALLANIRQMERFRRGFYAEIVAGRDPGSGPSSGPITLGNLSPGGGGTIGGLIALLRQQVLIRNQRANVVALRDSLEQLKAFFKADKVGYFQVEQTRLQYYQAQIRLLDLQNQYENAMDSYKIRLGLPPGLKVQAKDPLLDRFELISPELTDAQNQVTSLLANLRDPDLGSILREDVKRLSPIVDVCRVQIENVVEDIRRLDEALPTRRKNLRELAQMSEFRDGEVDSSIINPKLLDERVAKLKTQFAELRHKMANTYNELLPYQHMTPNQIPESGPAEKALREELTEIVGRLSAQMLSLSLYQAEARLDTVTLKPLTLAPRVALDIARENRRDWKNARAALVDVWRQVEVVANELESDLDVTFSGDLNTINGNPIQFRGTAGRLRVGLEFDAPLTRLAERNNYRRALINYQRARRQYYTYEDEVYRALRVTLRAIRLARINFEQRRALVYVAATQVDLKQIEMLHKPSSAAGGGLGDVAARDVIDAINDLLNQQNNFLEAWVNYEVQRLSLAFDLGTMKLDSRGMWIDQDSLEVDLNQHKEDRPEPIPLGPVVSDNDPNETQPHLLQPMLPKRQQDEQNPNEPAPLAFLPIDAPLDPETISILSPPPCRHETAKKP